MNKMSCSFTVVHKDGISYSASMLMPTIVVEEAVSHEAISFLCSGTMLTFKLNDITNVEYKQWIVDMNVAPNA